MKQVRCAIYTRKSSEEGLEQGFNSLHAQREACAAYVLSQASEGWTLLPDVYDDGGLSGGTLERPALQRLLGEVGAGKIDIIVIYKVDRLTRSLLDFAKLVEALDKAGTSFVSITQSFNTTTSMGRLTLNMLLSFAQFEREVTAERIRDKVAASKAKGMWMGGTPPLGYRPNGRSLTVVPEHAALIRDIYARYARLGNVRLLADELVAEGITTPKRKSAAGRGYGGGTFSRGQIYAILRSPIYVGDIPHRGKVHPGQHSAILERPAWEAVQRQLDGHVKGGRRARAAAASPLAGRIVDGSGAPLLASHANKPDRANPAGPKRRYRYYVTKALQTGDLADRALGMRLPAAEVEQFAAGELARLFADPLALADQARLELAPSDLAPLIATAKRLAAQAVSAPDAALIRFIEQVRVHDARIELDVTTAALAGAFTLPLALDAPPVLTLASDVRLTRTGRAIRLVHTNGAPAAAINQPDLGLIRLASKARQWWGVIAAGVTDPSTLAAQEKVSVSYLGRVLRLAFLSPAVIEAVLEGNLRAGVDGTALLATHAIALSWREQEQALVADGS